MEALANLNNIVPVGIENTSFLKWNWHQLHMCKLKQRCHKMIRLGGHLCADQGDYCLTLWITEGKGNVHITENAFYLDCKAFA